MPLEAVGETRYRRRAVLELGTIPGGYGWVFPKGDHVNVGVGGWEREGPGAARPSLRAMPAARHRRSSVQAIRGHRLPLRRAGSVAARGRALLVGDAAGLVDPLSGDGMYEAFVSARLASGAVLDLLAGRSASLDGYTHRAREGLRGHGVGIVGREDRARPLSARDVPARSGTARVARDGAHGPRGDRRAVRGSRAHASAAEGDRGAREAGRRSRSLVPPRAGDAA